MKLYIHILIVFAFSIVFNIGRSQNSSKDLTILKSEKFNHYIEKFNYNDNESIKNAIDNSQCQQWVAKNVPLFECPDKDIEEIYYFRWWVFRKHIKKTPSGYVITEFLPKVGHSKKYNTIVCAAPLHIEEGKWLRNREYISDYIKFWYSPDGDVLNYSNWIPSAIEEYCKTTGDYSLAEKLLPNFIKSYEAWEKSKLHTNGLFWSYDDRDGGEYSISGSGLRPTLNSYMYGSAVSISNLATRFGKKKTAKKFQKRASKLRSLFNEKIWSADHKFFCTIPLDKREYKVENYDFGQMDQNRIVRELYGYFPWRFMLPENKHEVAWKQLMSDEGFFAPYGPTTAEQRHPLFMKNRIKRCQWDGSSWPFATSITLKSAINLLNSENSGFISNDDFYKIFKIYTKSHHRTLPYGDVIPWIGESLHPTSGIWLSRAIAMEAKTKLVKSRGIRDKNHAALRGKDYNHSSYCDLVISGLAGLKITSDKIIVNPLIPSYKWNWFCLDGIKYKDKTISIVYDKEGQKYGKKAGLSLYINGELVAHSNKLKKTEVNLNDL